jgi:hypothetical protein
MKRVAFVALCVIAAVGIYAQTPAQKALYERISSSTVSSQKEDIQLFDARRKAFMGNVARTVNQFVEYELRSVAGKAFSLEGYEALSWSEYLDESGKVVSCATNHETLKEGEAAELSALSGGPLSNGTRLDLNAFYRAAHERKSLASKREGPVDRPDPASYKVARYVHLYLFTLRDIGGTVSRALIVDEHTVGSEGRPF